MSNRMVAALPADPSLRRRHFSILEDALANCKELGSILPAVGGNCEEVLSRFAEASINMDGLAARLQASVHSRSLNLGMS